MACLLWAEAGGGGDADCGDDRPDTARAFHLGLVDYRSRSPDIPEYGAQSVAFG
jgi:hypothetical protein